MGLRIFPNLLFLFIGAVCIANVQGGALWQEYELAGFENSNGTLFTSNIKSKRYDKTSFALNGGIEILSDVGNNEWTLELNLFYSAKGNNQFVKLPYKIPRDDICNVLDGIYIKSGAAKDVADASDFPQPKKGEPLCPSYTAGNYTLQQFVLKKDIVPQFLQPGYHKIKTTFYKKNSDITQSMTLHMKLY